jgi:hypothetical protein
MKNKNLALTGFPKGIFSKVSMEAVKMAVAELLP